MSGGRFTPADYDAILAAAKASGYRFGRFAEPDDGERVVYLRHDVDNTLEAALHMAEAEARAGAVATYLVLVRSENYNPFSRANAARLRRIRELGHDVGLHFAVEEHDPEAIAADLTGCIRADARLLEALVGESVQVFSFHNPVGKERFATEVAGLVNTYSDRFFADACYLSESNMRWPNGSPAEVLASGQHRVIQILVHPLSYRADLRSDRDVLLWFLREKMRDLLDLNVRQNRVLAEQGLSLAEVAVFLEEEGA